MPETVTLLRVPLGGVGVGRITKGWCLGALLRDSGSNWHSYVRCGGGCPALHGPRRADRRQKPANPCKVSPSAASGLRRDTWRPCTQCLCQPATSWRERNQESSEGTEPVVWRSPILAGLQSMPWQCPEQPALPVSLLGADWPE